MFALEARYYLGLYQGSTAQGEPEPYPTPARLFSALIAGACSLERLESDDADCDGAVRDRLDVELFDWIEHHPPDAISYPHFIQANSDAIAYRNKGGVKGLGDAAKVACSASTACSLDGPITWYWKTDPPSDVLERLDQVAFEVPYLGESASAVSLTVSKVEEIPESAFAKCDPAFGAQEAAVALSGRRMVLEATFAAARKRGGMDKTNKNEEERSNEPSGECLGKAYYAPPMLREHASHAAWRWGYVLAIDRAVSSIEWSSWAVCLHRAIVKRFGDGLPSILQQSRGRDRASANGVAIQFVDASMPIRDKTGIQNGAIVVMVPTDAPVGEEALVADALFSVTRLYSRDLGSLSVECTGERVDLARFWMPPEQGTKRLFETVPLFIPDSRPPRKRKSDGSLWAINDDARVAIGHVWRGLFPVTRSGDAGRLELSEAVSAAGVRVFGGRVVPTPNIRNYVHKANRGSLLVGARAFVDLDPLGCGECLSAIGQTRHMGGGLLVPFDVPEDLLVDSGGERRVGDE